MKQAHNQHPKGKRIMPGKKNASLKDPKLYEELRDEGASKEKAAVFQMPPPSRGARKWAAREASQAITTTGQWIN
jgi:hypothetical protein